MSESIAQRRVATSSSLQANQKDGAAAAQSLSKEIFGKVNAFFGIMRDTLVLRKPGT